MIEAGPDYWDFEDDEEDVPDPDPPSAYDPWWMGMRSDW